MRRDRSNVTELRRRRRWRLPTIDWRRAAAALALVITLGGGALWLYRDARTVVDDFGPDSGSLRVNINTATREELESVPGIGERRAGEIIARRPWSSIDDLESLPGVGRKQVEAWRTFLKTEGETEKIPQ